MQTESLPIAQNALKTAFRPIKDVLDWFKSDARHYQVLFQLTFLLYGIFALEWDIPIMRVNIVILSCLAVQAVWIHFKTKDWTGLKSALVSAMSICLMLQANSVWTFVLAAALSIGSKFFIRWNGKHIFNPTNFGICVTMMLTGDAWVSPGQWGSDAMLLFAVGLTGLVVLLRVKRLDTAFAFLLTFLGLMFARNILYLGWPVDFFFHQLNAGSLLLFTFFMITDPVQTPVSQKARLIWAVAVGVLAYYMSTKWWWSSLGSFYSAAPIWALFFLSPLVPVLDRFLKGEKFSWSK
jgi:Na+-translocating ferredoxin:NAD+ oxidoreductase RnfD subunit